MTESEQLYTNHIQINKLARLFTNERTSFDHIADYMPLMMSSNNVNDFEFNFFNKEFSDFIRKEREFIVSHGSSYTTSLLHPKNFEYVKASFEDFNYLNNRNNVFEYYQYVKPEGQDHYEWLISYKKFISQNQFFGIYHKVRDLGSSGQILRDYLGDIALSTSSYQKFQLLTQQEKRILRLIIRGEINKEIAEILYISVNTVRTHRNRIWKKLDIKHFKDCLKYRLMYH